jgi:3-hydroxyisobutyrate dehydrogenase-like beta-hydroxyacid dehydrogenase
MKNVAFIGLGNMGAPMARNLWRAGYAMTVYNRTPARAEPFREDGVAVASTPRTAAAEADIVLINVTDSDALRAVLEGEDGVLAGLTRGAVVVNTGTVAPRATDNALAAVTAAGGRFVDAPVSGTVRPAVEGTLVILAGGEENVIDELLPLFRVIGHRVIRCGAAGRATRMKLILNLLLGGMMGLLAEGLVLARRFGLDFATVLSAIEAGPVAAPLYAMKGSAIESGDFRKQFPVELMFKDYRLLIDGAAEEGVQLPLSEAARRLYGLAREQGYAEEDMAAVIKVIASLADTPAA